MARTKSKSFYNFRSSGEIATIDIFAEIDDWFGYTANQIKYDLANFEGSKIVVNINSGGGSVTEGIAIANLLKADPRHVTTRAVGIAASIASVILLAGNTVEMASGSFLMIHNTWAFAAGGAEELRQTADTLDNMSDVITEIYLDAINKNGKYVDGSRAKTKKTIKDLMSKETWLSAKQAKDLGLIDKIKTFETKASNKVRSRIYNQIKNQKFTIPSNMPKPTIKNEDVENAEHNLADVLQAKIDVLLAEDDTLTQADVVESMADAAGIDSGTVNQILRGDITCPPIERLEGFAEALSMPLQEILTAAETGGCEYGDDDEEETEEDSATETTEAENKEDDSTSEGEAVTPENKNILQKMMSGINSLLGRNKEAKAEPTNNKAEDDLKKQVKTLQLENKALKASVKKSKKSETEALDFLKETETELSKISQVKNRAGKAFKNLPDLISEYTALIAHNKEVGGLPVNPGTPVAEGELTNPVEKTTAANSKEDLHAHFDRLKKEAIQKAENKKDKK